MAGADADHQACGRVTSAHAPAAAAISRTTTSSRLPMAMPSLGRRLRRARQLLADGALEVGVGALELGLRLDVLGVDHLDLAERVDERHEVDRAGLVRALGHPE